MEESQIARCSGLDGAELFVQLRRCQPRQGLRLDAMPTLPTNQPWRNLKHDIADGLAHVSDFIDVDYLDPDEALNPTLYRQIKTWLSLPEIARYDDVAGWLEVDAGELAGADTAEILQWARHYRGTEFAAAVTDTLRHGFAALVIMDTSEFTGIVDGRGRFNLAVALGVEALPVLLLRDKPKRRKASTAAFRPKQLLTLGPLRVVSVDGAEIRRTVEPDFTCWAQPLRWPELIPPSEIWIDRDVVDAELPFYLTHAVVELAAMNAGQSYEAAEELGRQAEERERDKANQAWKHRPTVRGVKRRSLGIAPSGVEVWLVDGELVRTHLYTNFTAGGHDLVYPFVPDREVWVDDAYDASEWPFIVHHELVERAFMLHRDLSYPEAHMIALRYEQRLRNQP